MKKYNRISLCEREKIYNLVQSSRNQTEIANFLGRHKSSISNELKRCRAEPLGYLPDRAHLNAAKRYVRNPQKFCSSELCLHVVDKLKEGWSPEQIAGRLKLEANLQLKVSHETIYKFVYSQEGLSLKLPTTLTRRKPKRTKWYSRKPRRNHIPESASIKHRPASIEKRKSIGYWEGDLVIFRALQSSNVTTLLERKSRYIKLVRNSGKYTKNVIGGIQNALKDLPKFLRKSITYDRGKEFASYKNLNMPTYFCDPHSPWQKGGCENFNGRLRRFLPKKFNPLNLSQKLLDNLAEKFNNQPRKCLGYKTPAEVFTSRHILPVALDP